MAEVLQGAEIGRAHSELQSRVDLVCRLLLEKKKKPLRPHLPLHIKRYPLSPPHVGPRGGDVSRRDRGDRLTGGGSPRAQASVHAGAALGHSRRRSHAAPRAHRAQGRGGKPPRRASRLSLPPALPFRLRPLPCRAPPASRRRRGSRGRLPSLLKWVGASAAPLTGWLGSPSAALASVHPSPPWGECRVRGIYFTSRAMRRPAW